ncbi:MAG: bacteriohemerythrin [Magnetococcales bacterium]|nr:bacteriohemerythrin [Magnetococcales bacterium]
MDSFEVFPWNDNFAIGIDEIDHQHMRLVDLLNELTATLIQDNDAELTRIFDELASYTHYHFSTEEMLWKEYFQEDDAWLQNHQDVHASFLPKVVQLKEESGDAPLADVIENIVRFLIRWLAFHIIDNDKRMATVLKYVQAGETLSDAKLKTEKEMTGATGLLIETILKMYDGLSSRTLDLLRERLDRIRAEEKLKEAYRQLEKLSITDQLTGLYNRRHFDNTFSQEFRRAAREKKAVTFLMFDVDHFKKLNDRYGHIGGDVALTKIGTLLINLCRRPGDFAFRLGGEEFGILTTEQSPQAAYAFAETIRTSIEALDIPNVDSDVADHMTISVGLITRIPEQDDNPDTFVSRADAYLYQAKEQGRNRVMASD